jgi:hypothetical protein
MRVHTYKPIGHYFLFEWSSVCTSAEAQITISEVCSIFLNECRDCILKQVTKESITYLQQPETPPCPEAAQFKPQRLSPIYTKAS